MSTKENLSDQLNQVLGVSVEWSKMSREDLETLVKVFGDPIGVVQLGLKMMKEKTREDIMGRKLGDILSSSSILNLRDRSRGGPLGLGILPGLFGQNEKSSSETKSSKEETPQKSEPETAPEKHEDEKKPET